MFIAYTYEKREKNMYLCHTNGRNVEEKLSWRKDEYIQDL